MSIKSKVLAGAAALTMATGVGALATGTAHAATPSCADNCVDIFSPASGSHPRPNFLLDVLRQGQKSGQPVILYRTSNNDPAEDFQPENAGLVSDFVNAGLISKSVGLHYGGTACRDGYPITG